ncbi:MAG: GNAT family N-acetyltransferase [Alphaproteobacteria bacterium]|nr:MAG: GNAT family N-acetyltransferase [Alphaproteobacteria bacterium]
MPDTRRLLAAIDATWPAASISRAGPWVIREGAGGGQRVSAASAAGPVREADIETAEKAMRALGQNPLFILAKADRALDGWLEARGYEVVDPVNLYAAPVEVIARQPFERMRAFAVWPLLAIMRDLWAAGGVGPERIAVMERAEGPATGILARTDDRPAGVAFAAIDREIAMIHAIHVAPELRRSGTASNIMRCAARWAQDRGAKYLALAVTRSNLAANGLYSSLGMKVVGNYHYRRAKRDG